MTDLATQIENAAPEQARYMLLAAFKHCLPKPALSAEHFNNWSNVYVKFYNMLDAEAWTSAAELLVPEGMAWTVGYGQYLPTDQMCAAVIGRNAKFISYETNYDAVAHGDGNHPWAALASACVRARG